jgi:hypothetical protein
MLDLALVPVLDNHCHPFASQFEELTLERLGCLLHSSPHAGHGKSEAFSATTARILGFMAEFLGCPSDAATILRTRNERATAYRTYIRDLFSDAGIESLLIDSGYPRNGGPDYSALEETSPVPLGRVFRVESLFAGYQEGRDTLLFAQDPPQAFSSFLERYVHKLTQALDHNVVAIKTILAYTTGLAVEDVSYKEAKEAFQAYLAGDAHQEKPIRDFLFIVAAEFAARQGIPLQVHTGHTGAKRPWHQANPILLQGALGDSRCRKTTFVLLHGGYPFTSEAGYLASAFPNVHVDISLIMPFASLEADRRLAEILEFAPFDKILYGSDGFGEPELAWFGAKMAKRALSVTLGHLLESQDLAAAAAYRAAELVLSRNAQRVYNWSR